MGTAYFCTPRSMTRHVKVTTQIFANTVGVDAFTRSSSTSDAIALVATTNGILTKSLSQSEARNIGFVAPTTRTGTSSTVYVANARNAKAVSPEVDHLVR